MTQETYPTRGREGIANTFAVKLIEALGLNPADYTYLSFEYDCHADVSQSVKLVTKPPNSVKAKDILLMFESFDLVRCDV